MALLVPSNLEISNRLPNQLLDQINGRMSGRISIDSNFQSLITARICCFLNLSSEQCVIRFRFFEFSMALMIGIHWIQSNQWNPVIGLNPLHLLEAY